MRQGGAVWQVCQGGRALTLAAGPCRVKCIAWHSKAVQQNVTPAVQNKLCMHLHALRDSILPGMERCRTLHILPSQ